MMMLLPILEQFQFAKDKLTKLFKNTASKNGGDGFDISGADCVLDMNKAARNGVTGFTVIASTRITNSVSAHNGGAGYVGFGPAASASTGAIVAPTGAVSPGFNLDVGT